MAKDNVEIEIRFPLHNADEVAAFLDKHGTVESKNVEQKDTYFNPPHKDFLAPQYPFEWLRLRETKHGASINYKHFYPENELVDDYCDEFQTSVANATSMRTILESLGFRELIVVDKHRSIWKFHEVEISIDKVERLGTFIELEATTTFTDPKAAKAYLHEIARKLNAHVGEEDNKGYPWLLIEKTKQKH